VKTVVVWDRPLRLWHWSLAILILIAWVTPNTYDSLHRFAGYAVIGLLAFRLVWGFVGTRHSRFDKVGLRLRAAPDYLKNLFHGNIGRYLGLNPAGVAMLVAMLALLAISTVTGAMQVTVRFFGVWWIEDTHAYSSQAVIVLAGLHVLGTLLMSVLQRENLVRAMFTGRKHPPGSTSPRQGARSPLRADQGRQADLESGRQPHDQDDRPSVVPAPGLRAAARVQTDPVSIDD
jgi:cytochrome b